MTRIFYDCEFLENGRTIDLISIGMVTENEAGPTLYAVNDALLNSRSGDPNTLHARVCRHPWLMSNVVPHLPLKMVGNGPMYSRSRPGERGDSFTLDPESRDVLPLRLIRASVRDFITQWSEPELWAWYGAYDHVALAWLFGPMINLPSDVPMWTNDIRTLAMLAGPEAMATAPRQESQPHHALNDARHDRDLYDHYAPLVDARRLA